MGITKLAELIRSDVPEALSHKDISDYSGKAIALDTSIVLHQFRAAIPSTLNPLMGLFYRTIGFLEHDIKPVFVFDGKPPEEKRLTLEKRAKNAGWGSPKLSSTESSHIQDCQNLLKLLGVPVVQAPGDAEALCAWLVKKGLVHGVASEDMDTLPFGAAVLIRQFNANKFGEIVEYSLAKLLEKLQITHEEFVDLCILLGCDYCEKITGFGPKRALTLIQKHRTIENIVLHINQQTHPVPEFWKYKEARDLFLGLPETEPPELTWSEPDEEALVQFLCRTKYFKEDRVRNRMERFREVREFRRKEREKARAAGPSKQTHMEDFFKCTRKRTQPLENASSTKRTRSSSEITRPTMDTC
ncbi:probable flap endonuclease 1 homolog [Synchiropus splendidus]|uniref:probable flap endonuclease 1 homolog n=1 Tax=Synchiropus splendidus TaxID=270530 RepID=UPI00237E576E|nr:probable flap endonuclease 1 homolog [Synchiropus splendidus]